MVSVETRAPLGAGGDYQYPRFGLSQEWRADAAVGCRPSTGAAEWRLPGGRFVTPSAQGHRTGKKPTCCLAWRLGIGCGGAAEILLHPCHAGNHFLALDQVFEHLRAQQACRFQLGVDKDAAVVAPCPKAFHQRQAGKIIDNHLVTLINPLPHLLILGSGIDMVPLCELALAMGWRVTLADQRLSHQRRDNFPAGAELLQASVTDLDAALLQHVDGIIIAHHNLVLDAAALRGLNSSGASYIGLLGPAQRKREVLAAAAISEHQLPVPVAGPMGLALGGDLPESIALSVLAECHAVIYGSSATALSEAYAFDTAQDISGPRPNLGTFNAAG
jgi:xanthine dehydrogenase accessory factor